MGKLGRIDGFDVRMEKSVDGDENGGDENGGDRKGEMKVS